MRACRRGQKNTRFESPCKGYFSRQAAPRAIRHLYRVVVSLQIKNQLTSTNQATKQTDSTEVLLRARTAPPRLPPESLVRRQIFPFICLDYFWKEMLCFPFVHASINRPSFVVSTSPAAPRPSPPVYPAMFLYHPLCMHGWEGKSE